MYLLHIYVTDVPEIQHVRRGKHVVHYRPVQLTDQRAHAILAHPVEGRDGAGFGCRTAPISGTSM